MSLDTQTAAKQLAALKQYAADARRIESGLKRYRKQLNAAWSAKEITFLNRVNDDLTGKYKELASSLDALQQDMTKAIDEITGEEAAAQEEAAARKGGIV